MIDQFLTGGMAFCQNCVGLITRPYQTYRKIINHGSLWELAFVGFVLAFYFALASIVKTSAFRPFLLTKEFVKLSFAAGLTYLLVASLLWYVGTWVRGKGTFKEFSLSWGYTLIPTVTWFFITSLLYVILPPPRTTSPAGIAFSILFLVFSATLFFWKAMLAYLSLRFALRLDLFKILVVFSICLPIVAVYSVLMYKIGIFKVPFL